MKQYFFILHEDQNCEIAIGSAMALLGQPEVVLNRDRMQYMLSMHNLRLGSTWHCVEALAGCAGASQNSCNGMACQSCQSTPDVDMVITRLHDTCESLTQCKSHQI